MRFNWSSLGNLPTAAESSQRLAAAPWRCTRSLRITFRSSVFSVLILLSDNFILCFLRQVEFYLQEKQGREFFRSLESFGKKLSDRKPLLKTVLLIKASFMLLGNFYFVVSLRVHHVPVKRIFMFVQLLTDTLFVRGSGAPCFDEDTDFNITVIFLDCDLRLLHRKC